MYNEHVDARQNTDGSWEWEDFIATSAEDLAPGTYWVASASLYDHKTGSSSSCCYPTPGESPYTFVVADDPAYTTSVPVISGRAQVPYTLSADPGMWGPGPVDLSYQWTTKSLTGWPLEAQPTEGATGRTYQLKYGLYQDQLQVRVTGTWPDGTKRTRFSEPITKVLNGDLGAHKATLTGTAAVETDSQATSTVPGLKERGSTMNSLPPTARPSSRANSSIRRRSTWVKLSSGDYGLRGRLQHRLVRRRPRDRSEGNDSECLQPRVQQRPEVVRRLVNRSLHYGHGGGRSNEPV